MGEEIDFFGYGNKSLIQESKILVIKRKFKRNTFLGEDGWIFPLILLLRKAHYSRFHEYLS